MAYRIPANPSPIAPRDPEASAAQRREELDQAGAVVRLHADLHGGATAALSHRQARCVASARRASWQLCGGRLSRAQAWLRKARRRGCGPGCMRRAHLCAAREAALHRGLEHVAKLGRAPLVPHALAVPEASTRGPRTHAHAQRVSRAGKSRTWRQHRACTAQRNVAAGGPGSKVGAARPHLGRT
jgi:hypothetical protein